MALFEHVGPNRFVPTALTTGPWRSDAMHGAPPSALAERLVETCRQGGEFIAANVELERPVPLEPLTASAPQVRRHVTQYQGPCQAPWISTIGVIHRPWSRGRGHSRPEVTDSRS